MERFIARQKAARQREKNIGVYFNARFHADLICTA
jgi:hypothetical protein